MTSVKIAVMGEPDQEPSSETITQVANEVYAQDLIRLMIVHMESFEFEVRSACSLAVYILEILRIVGLD